MQYKNMCLNDFILQEHYNAKIIIKLQNFFMDNRLIENLEKLKKMLLLLSEERKVVLSHRKTFEHVEKMRSIVNESIEMVNKS